MPRMALPYNNYIENNLMKKSNLIFMQKECEDAIITVASFRKEEIPFNVFVYEKKIIITVTDMFTSFSCTYVVEALTKLLR